MLALTGTEMEMEHACASEIFTKEGYEIQRAEWLESICSQQLAGKLVKIWN
jgi:hypothetical protein